MVTNKIIYCISFQEHDLKLKKTCAFVFIHTQSVHLYTPTCIHFKTHQLMSTVHTVLHRHNLSTFSPGFWSRTSDALRHEWRQGLTSREWQLAHRKDMMCHPQCMTPLDQKVGKKKWKKKSIYIFKLWANHNTRNLDANDFIATDEPESVTSWLGKAVFALGVTPSQQWRTTTATGAMWHFSS